MRLLFKQRFLSWFDSYDIYDEEGRTAYTVEGQAVLGTPAGDLRPGRRPPGDGKGRSADPPAPVRPLCGGRNTWGASARNLPCFTPRFTLDCNGWEVEGSFLEWDYAVTDPAGRTVMAASKELLHWTDTYVLDIARPEDALLCLMIVLAIDAAKCSAGNG